MLVPMFKRIGRTSEGVDNNNNKNLGQAGLICLENLRAKRNLEKVLQAYNWGMVLIWSLVSISTGDQASRYFLRQCLKALFLDFLLRLYYVCQGLM